MQTIYDWITVFLFAGLVTRYLQQSAADTGEDASLLHYLIAAIGCAVANWLGNRGDTLPAVAVIAITMAYAGFFILGVGRNRTRQ
jgi:Flp pilus assembly protein TadB